MHADPGCNGDGFPEHVGNFTAVSISSLGDENFPVVDPFVVALNLIRPAVPDTIGVDERDRSLKRLGHAAWIVRTHGQAEWLSDGATPLSTEGCYPSLGPSRRCSTARLSRTRTPSPCRRSRTSVDTITAIYSRGELAIAVVLTVPEEVTDTALDLHAGKAIEQLWVVDYLGEMAVGDHLVAELVQPFAAREPT